MQFVTVTVVTKFAIVYSHVSHISQVRDELAKIHDFFVFFNAKLDRKQKFILAQGRRLELYRVPCGGLA